MVDYLSHLRLAPKLMSLIFHKEFIYKNSYIFYEISNDDTTANSDIFSNKDFKVYFMKLRQILYIK